MPTSSVELHARPGTPDSTRLNRPPRSAWLPQGAVLVIPAVVIFLLHARWWQGGQVEDWSFGQVWLFDGGWSHYISSFGATAGRPLQDIPGYTGAMIANGAEWGQWVIDGALAVGVFLSASWALKPISGRGALALLACCVIALHPAWEGGFTLRFGDAFVSTIGAWLALGFVVRWLTDSTRLTLLAAVCTGFAGLLAYEADALACLLIAAYIALLLPADMKRRLAAIGAMLAAVVLDLIWVEVFVKHLFPRAYETTTAGSYHIFSGIGSIASTLWNSAPEANIILIVLFLGIGALAVTRVVTARSALLAGAVTVLAPLTALTYANNASWVNDPTRICFPISLTIGAVAAGLTYDVRRHTRPAQAGLGLGAVAATITMSVVSIVVWAHYGSIQKRTLTIVKPAVLAAKGDQMVYVVDHSGYLGNIYTFLPPILNEATMVSFHDTSPVTLCTADGVTRKYSIAYTPECSAVPVPAGAKLVSRGTIEGKPVDAYIGPPAS